MTNKKPVEILFNKIPHENIPEQLKTAQIKMLQQHYKNRLGKDFNVGEIIYEKIIGERNKFQPRYKKTSSSERLR